MDRLASSGRLWPQRACRRPGSGSRAVRSGDMLQPPEGIQGLRAPLAIFMLLCRYGLVGL